MGRAMSAWKVTVNETQKIRCRLYTYSYPSARHYTPYSLSLSLLPHDLSYSSRTHSY